MSGSRILVVEDELLTIELIRDILEAHGHDVVDAVVCGEKALASIEKRRPDLIILDVRIKGAMDGVELAGIVNERFDIPIIYMTAFSDGDMIARAKKTRSYGYLIKPFGEHELMAAVEMGLYKYSLDAKLRESDERYRTLFESIKDAVYIHDMKGRMIDFNPALEELFGYTRDEVFGINARDVFVDQENADSLLGEITHKGFVKDFLVTYRRKDGGIIHCLVTATLVVPSSGRNRTIRGIIRNVTEQRRMEEALRDSEEKYRLLVENINDAIFSLGTDGTITYMSPAIESISGYRTEDIIGKNFRELVHPDDLPRVIDRFARNLSGDTGPSEFRVLDRDGSVRYVRTSSRAVAQDGAVAWLNGLLTDVTEQHRMEDELRKAHSEIVHLLNSITSILIGVSTGDVITHWNHMAEKTFGITSEEALGRAIMGFNIDWEWDGIYTGISSCISENCPVNINDVTFRDKNGREGILGITINPITGESGALEGFLIFGRDVTEKRLMERQLLQSSKLATIGEIATGIAHELNQPLNVIKSAAQFLMDGIKEKYYTEEFIEERVGKILAQTDRAAHIITHLRDFGRKSGEDHVPVNPNVPIMVALDLLKEQLKLLSIHVEQRLSEDLPPVMGDAMKLEQVFINLAVNAKDAMDEMGDGRRERVIDVSSRFDEASGIVCIEFSDNGPGIPSDCIERIFDPFFTTKEVGKGTGLGLSISYGIIKSHGGDISVSSGPDGTTFHITLPATGTDESKAGGMS